MYWFNGWEDWKNKLSVITYKVYNTPKENWNENNWMLIEKRQTATSKSDTLR